jgi:hypothetical protein
MKERMAAARWQESVEENGLAEEVYQSNDDDMMMLRKRDESNMPTDTVLIAWCRQSWTVRRMMMDDG